MDTTNVIIQVLLAGTSFTILGFLLLRQGKLFGQLFQIYSYMVITFGLLIILCGIISSIVIFLR